MKRRARKTARVVPSLVLTASFVGVVPACALVSCSDGQGTGQDVYAGGDVADVAFRGGGDVAACCFDANFGVADAGFVVDADADASDDSPSDAANDSPDGDR